MSTTGARHRADPAPRGFGPVLVVLAVAGVVLAGGLLARLVGEPGDVTPAAPPTVVTPASSEAGSTSEPSGDVGDLDPDPTADAPSSGAEPTGVDVPVPGPVGGSATPPAGDVVPVRLAAPAIDLRLDGLDLLGVEDDGTIEVPAAPDDAGWLTASAVPGRTGPAVIAGHVDSVDGPAVFARLAELAPGDEITVGLADGTDVVYRVTATETSPKDAFPTDAVYGPVPAPALRLITCGGRFDTTAGSYDDNVVVYAVLAG